jgi:rhodanese-related sulfurtransferase
MERLTTEELMLLLEDEPDIVLINVLGEDEFESGRIPHSLNVPVSREGFEEEVGELVGNIDTAIVVYGADAECEASEIAASKLEGAGFTRVYEYENGLEEWHEIGGGIERGSP